MVNIPQEDQFKNWLTAVLKPICDADPVVLCKYVVALLKKDKPEDDRRKSMVSQLNVFLQDETTQFVDLVFETLNSQIYLSTPLIPNANPPNPNVSSKVKETKEMKVIVPPNDLPDLTEVVNGTATERKNDVKKTESKVKKLSENGEKELNKPKKYSRRRSLSRHRSKSRSRSWDRVKRSRSREREYGRTEKRDRNRNSDRERSNRNWRKSPNYRPKPYSTEASPPVSPSSPLHYPQSPSYNPSSPAYRAPASYRTRSPCSPNPSKIRSRSRSPRHSHRNRFTRRSRSRSRSLEKRERRDSKDVKNHSSKPLDVLCKPTFVQPRPSSPIPVVAHSETDTLVSSTNQMPPGSANNRKRCRDFDEMGYCMRGEMCPFDHGSDPVVLEDSTLSHVLSYNPEEGVAGALAARAASLPSPPVHVGAGAAVAAAAPLRQPVIDNLYNPQAPQMWPGVRFRAPRHMPGGRLPNMNSFTQPPPSVGLQRELIAVPVVDNSKVVSTAADGYTPVSGVNNNNNNNNIYGNTSVGGVPTQGSYAPHSGVENSNPNSFKKRFDFNRLGPRKNNSNCSLELKKVPIGINTITHLNNHFAKFGKIVNIQVQYEGDAEAALVTFSTHAEANSAYRCTEAVLNNRFIKLFWHDNNDGSKQENLPPSQQRSSIKHRLGGTTNAPPGCNKVLNLVQPKAGEVLEDAAKEDKDDDNKNTLSREEQKAQANAAIKKNQELLAAQAQIIKTKDENHKEILKMQSDLSKKKQDLLQQSLSDLKMLLDKFEKLPPGPARDDVKNTIKITENGIKKIKEDIERSALAAKNAIPSKKTKEEAQKELLDTELDLIAKQQEGADTTELQKKLMELSAVARSMTSAIRGGGRGALTSRGRGRYTMPVVNRRLLSKNNLKDPKLKGNIKTVNKIINNVNITASSQGLNNSVQKSVVDNRPTRLLISGYETDEQDSVLKHFQEFGEIVDYIIDPTLPSITVDYKTRKDAEMAMLRGKHFQDRTLSITWQANSVNRTLQTQKSSSSGGSSVTASSASVGGAAASGGGGGGVDNNSSNKVGLLLESEEDHLIDQSLLEGDEELAPETEEALLQDDEEEDEEDRSWRR